MYDVQKLIEDVHRKIDPMTPEEFLAYCDELGILLVPRTEESEPEFRYDATIMQPSKVPGRFTTVKVSGYSTHEVQLQEIVDDALDALNSPSTCSFEVECIRPPVEKAPSEKVDEPEQLTA